MRTGRGQLGPEMLADLEVVLRNDGERQHPYVTHERTRDALPLDILERFEFCLTGSGSLRSHAFRLGCGPIDELRLLALENAERHGKLEALYHKCGFRTAGAARFECDTDHTY